jgi:hypothetical protein
LVDEFGNRGKPDVSSALKLNGQIIAQAPMEMKTKPLFANSKKDDKELNNHHGDFLSAPTTKGAPTGSWMTSFHFYGSRCSFAGILSTGTFLFL